MCWYCNNDSAWILVIRLNKNFSMLETVENDSILHGIRYTSVNSFKDKNLIKNQENWFRLVSRIQN